MRAPSEQKTSLPFVTLLQGWDERWGGAACFKSVQVEQTVWTSFSLCFLITGGRKQLGSCRETKRYLHKRQDSKARLIAEFSLPTQGT